MHRWKIMGGLVVLVTLLGLAAPAAAQDPDYQADLGCIGGKCIYPEFAAYWREQGGLPVFGYVVKPESIRHLHERTNADGVFLYSLFERTRLEWHPENARPYHVLLGLMGIETLEHQGRDWHNFPKADPTLPHYFAETGHAIAPEFYGYWSSHGLEFDGQTGKTFAESLALFGYPISEPAMETNASGDTVLTQWYERARFEYHPNNPDEYKVLLGLLGSESVAAQSAQFQLLNPAPAVTIQTLAPSFEVVIPEGYSGSPQLDLATDPDFNNLVVAFFLSHDYSIQDPFFEGNLKYNLEPSTRYYWRVSMDDPNGVYIRSEVREFTTGPVTADMLLQAPHLIAPLEGATVSRKFVEVQWTGHPLASYYYVDLSPEAFAERGPTMDSGSAYLRYTHQPGDTLHWRVRERNAHGWGGESETWTATVTE